MIESAMGDTPVVLLNGVRQTGKTTLVQVIPFGENLRAIPMSSLWA